MIAKLKRSRKRSISREKRTRGKHQGGKVSRSKRGISGQARISRSNVDTYYSLGSLNIIAIIVHLRSLSPLKRKTLPTRSGPHGLGVAGAWTLSDAGTASARSLPREIRDTPTRMFRDVLVCVCARRPTQAALLTAAPLTLVRACLPHVASIAPRTEQLLSRLLPCAITHHPHL